MTYAEQTNTWAQNNLTGIALTGVLAALKIIPDHLVPRIKLDSQSPWAYVDAIPGPSLVVWLTTGDVYEVGENGAVGDNPVISTDKPVDKPPKTPNQFYTVMHFLNQKGYEVRKGFHGDYAHHGGHTQRMLAEQYKSSQ